MRVSDWVLLTIVLICLLMGIRTTAERNSARVSRAATMVRYPRVIDSIGLLPPGEAGRLEDYLRRLREESGVDVRLLFLAHKPDVAKYGVRAVRILRERRLWLEGE